MKLPHRLYWLRVASLILLAGALTLATYYPVGRLWLTVGAFLYWLVLLRYPSHWLLVLPILLSVVNIAPWSGWILLDEFDIFAVVTISSILWHIPYFEKESAIKNSWAYLAIAAMGIVWLFGWIRFLPFPPLSKDAFGTYETVWNSLRMAKGFFWALFLIPAVRKDLSDESSRHLFFRGVCMALFLQVLGVLWERGVIHDLLHASNLYEALSSLLNFSTAYRTTGLFSEMHLGGAAGDGFLILVWPLAAVMTLDFNEAKWWRIFAGLSTLGGLYAVVVTFTRGTYISVALGAFVIVAMGVLKNRKRLPVKMVIAWGCAGILGLVLFFFLFKRGGFFALIAATIAVAAGLLSAKTSNPFTKRLFFLFSGCLSIAGMVFMAHALMTSKWVDNSLITALLVSIPTTTIIVISIYFLVQKRPPLVSKSIMAWCIIIAVVSCCVAIPAIGGKQMKGRFSETNRDSGLRIQHWRDTLSIMGKETKTILFGRGLGTFPMLFWKSINNMTSPPHTIIQEDGYFFMRLYGAGNLLLGQRVPLHPGESYLFSALVRTSEKKTILPVKIEHRNILLEEYNPHKTVRIKLEDTGKLWSEVQVEIPTGDIGKGKWYESWPTVLELGFGRKGGWVDMDDVSLRSPDGKELLKNGSFIDGWSHWFQYSDHEHLPWHVKNLYLNIFFDLGIIGLLFFVVLLCIGCIRCFKSALNGNWLAAALGGSLIGFLSFGMVESPIDAARICFLFFLILFAATTLPVQKGVTE